MGLRWNIEPHKALPSHLTGRKSVFLNALNAVIPRFPNVFGLGNNLLFIGLRPDDVSDFCIGLDNILL